MEQNAVVSMPRIGDKAPAFKAVTTQGEINFPDQYAGSWVILFSHPADFTPVCTSEFMTFASLEEKFAKPNCKLVGLSVDGLYSHIAWLRTIKEKIEYKGMKNVEVKFPLIEDITMEVAKKLRHDPAGRELDQGGPRGLCHRPQGRHPRHHLLPAEPRPQLRRALQRVLMALQTADAFGVATPADWRPGDDVIVPTAGSCGVAKERMEAKDASVTCHDWFFCTKKIDKEKVLSSDQEEVGSAAYRLRSGDLPLGQARPRRWRDYGLHLWPGPCHHGPVAAGGQTRPVPPSVASGAGSSVG